MEGSAMNLRTTVLFSAVMMVSCGPSGKLIKDPAYSPFTVTVSAVQLSATSSELTAVVYGVSSFTPATVKFYNDETLIGIASTGTYINNTRSMRFKTTFNSTAKTTYRVKAVVNWASDEIKHIDSNYIGYTTD
jgi:hypothetical protein